MRKFAAAIAVLAGVLFPVVAGTVSADTASAGTATASRPVVADSAAATKQVCARDLYVRNRPGGNPVATLVRGDKVKTIRSSGIWVLVDSRVGRGWVDGRYLC